MFRGYGSHYNEYPVPYLNVACAIGITLRDIEVSLERIAKVLREVKRK
jgi:hypothetical protein